MNNVATEKRRFSKRWTDAEKRYLITYKTEGAECIASALGRSVSSVQVMASRLRVSLERAEGEICPKCGAREVRRGTSSGRHGLCPVCWERAKAAAIRERREYQSAQREYDAEKHRRRR